MPSLEEDTESELQALVGTTVAGKYRVDRLIGRGGMGAVFQATHLAIGKRVALKFLHHEACQNREACQRFQREAEAAGMVESAHIVQIFDSGNTEAGLPFLVMELLSGEDLRARMRREGRLATDAALRITSQVLRALRRAHAAGIVHRDLKPENIFLCARDDDPSFVKIVDFGISKLARARIADTLTQRGAVLGTAFYMSPEQAQSLDDLDARTDLFSVGAILFEMLSGGPPQLGPSYEAVLINICTHDAVDVRTRAPEVPATVAALLTRALARDRALRFQSAQEFLAAVGQAELGIAPMAATARPSSPGQASIGHAPLRALPPKRYGTLLACVIATLSGFALTAYFVAQKRALHSASPAAPLTAASIAPALSASAILPSTPLVATSAARVEPQATRAPVLEKVRHPAASKPSGHVAGGLQLSTKEP